MSVYYSELRLPWTSIRVERDSRHARITLWDSGANAGTLTVDASNEGIAVRSFFESDHVCQASGRPNGLHLIRFGTPRTDQVLAETGQIVSYADMEKTLPIDREQEARLRLLGMTEIPDDA